jgi:hypothetical protein
MVMKSSIFWDIRHFSPLKANQHFGGTGLQMHRNNFDEIYFQQHGAPPHYDICVREFLDNALSRKVISRSRSINMPPRSPDITSMNFYFWGAVKNKACTTQPKMIGNRKLATEDAFAKTGKETCSFAK